MMGKIFFLVLVVIFATYFVVSAGNINMVNRGSALITLTAEPTNFDNKTYPIAEFGQRITKKPFGIHITPQNSPIQPERFAGFHTGVDVEYQDVVDDVPVMAVCDGEMVLARWVSGYGGVVVLKCQENFVVYGHLRVGSIVKKTSVIRGEQIAVLGKGGTIETDYERKHLHFGIHKNALDLRGYVQKAEELIQWIDPSRGY